MTAPSPLAPQPPGPLKHIACSELASLRTQSLLAIGSGLLLGLCMPGHRLPLAWTVVFVPLFVALEGLHRQAQLSIARRGWRTFVLCWWVGVLMAAVSGAWVVNTSHVYGGLPLVLAHTVNLFGYGTLQGIDTFLFLGVPFVLAGRSSWVRLPLLLLWSTALPPLVPRFLYWTYGQLMFALAPLVQAADLLGSSGLNLLVVGLNLLLFAWVRYALMAPGRPGWGLTLATAGTALAFGLAWSYGTWRAGDIAARGLHGAPLRLVGVQPNFSLKALASNPALSPSDREQSISALVGDTERALARLPAEDDEPTLVVWPESAYPGAYALDARLRAAIESWVRAKRVHLVLATLDAGYPERPGGERPFYGATVHVAPGGQLAGIYHKIVLIPFGETIPFGRWFPWYRSVLKEAIPEISEFTPGDAYTVFPIAPGVRLAPMICFDAAGYRVALGMRRAGANLGVVLANLAWFGPTTVADQFEQYVRFRAIETRMPMLLLSQNGTSVLFDAAGEMASRRLPQFQADALALRVRVPEIGSFYAQYAPWVHGFFAAMLAGVVLVHVLRWRHGP